MNILVTLLLIKLSRQASFAKISDVHFRNIRGTSGSNVAVAVLYCSSAIPSEGIELADIDLTLSPNASKKFPLYATRNAKTFSRGKQNPPACR